jgi:hypothetical protein
MSDGLLTRIQSQQQAREDPSVPVIPHVIPSIPVIPAAVVTPVEQPVQPMCRHCAHPIVQKGGEWVHVHGGVGQCSPLSMTLPDGSPNWDYRFGEGP